MPLLLLPRRRFGSDYTRLKRGAANLRIRLGPDRPLFSVPVSGLLYGHAVTGLVPRLCRVLLCLFLARNCPSRHVSAASADSTDFCFPRTFIKVLAEVYPSHLRRDASPDTRTMRRIRRCIVLRSSETPPFFFPEYSHGCSAVARLRQCRSSLAPDFCLFFSPF